MVNFHDLGCSGFFLEENLGFSLKLDWLIADAVNSLKQRTLIRRAARVYYAMKMIVKACCFYCIFLFVNIASVRLTNASLPLVIWHGMGKYVVTF